MGLQVLQRVIGLDVSHDGVSHPTNYWLAHITYPNRLARQLVQHTRVQVSWSRIVVLALAVYIRSVVWDS